MDNLKQGDVLIHLEDNSRWEFIEYHQGYMTLKTEDVPAGGTSGEDKSFIHVRRLGIVGSHDEDDEWMNANEFKKED